MQCHYLAIQVSWCNVHWISSHHNTNYFWCYRLLLIKSKEDN
jgi:hypothetical protein